MNISQCPFDLMPIIASPVLHFPDGFFASGVFQRSRESPLIRRSISVAPVSSVNAVLVFENNAIITMGSVQQSIVFVMIIEPFRVRCYRHNEHIWAVLLHRSPINRGVIVSETRM